MKVVAIHLAPATRLPVRAVGSVDAEAGKGLIGDRVDVDPESGEAVDEPPSPS